MKIGLGTKTAMLVLGLTILNIVVFAGGQSGREMAASPVKGYQRDPNLNPSGTFPINKNTVSLRIGVEQNAMVEDFETNWMTRQVEEKGNYNLSFELYPTGEMNQKLELMVMAGGTDLPDVLIGGGFNLASITKYGQAGMLVPLNDYYKNSAYWINESINDLNYDPIKYITSYDGNIYGMFATGLSVNNEYSPARIMIYEPWLQKLGLAMPQSTGEFLAVLRAFRDRDPNGNGLKDEIPLMGNRDNMGTNYLYAMMMPFIYTQQNFWMINNGKIDVPFNKPGWREGLRYTKQLVDEGLLSPLSFTQDNVQLFAVVSPDPPKVGSFVGISGSRLGANDIKRSQYVILPPLEGPVGRQALWTPQLPSIRMLITKNCKTPESAFMMGDFLGREDMSVAQYYGEKDVDWLPPGPNEKGYWDDYGYKAQARPILKWGTLQNKHWAGNGPQIRGMKWAGADIATDDPYDMVAPLGRTIGPAIQFANRNPIVGLIYNEQEQEIMNDLYTTITTYVQESFARFATGDLNIDRDWDSYVAEFDKMSLQDVIKATQSAWDRMNK
ncbi:MAG: extracellular solute-binding protein [Treponema sp.]|nr:extracellular solute-binding protein [Treponema sp.]